MTVGRTVAMTCPLRKCSSCLKRQVRARVTSRSTPTDGSRLRALEPSARLAQAFTTIYPPMGGSSRRRRAKALAREAAADDDDETPFDRVLRR